MRMHRGFTRCLYRLRSQLLFFGNDLRVEHHFERIDHTIGTSAIDQVAGTARHADPFELVAKQVMDRIAQRPIAHLARFAKVQGSAFFFQNFRIGNMPGILC